MVEIDRSICKINGFRRDGTVLERALKVDKMFDIEDRVGVSSFWMPGVSLEEAINLASAKGFKSFEVVPADFQGVVGYPYTMTSAGVWLRTCSKERRSNLIKRLKENFKIVTVHAPHLGVNIASINHGWREESIRQYIECIEFARDLGSSIVTFHPGGKTWGFNQDPKEIIQYNIEFGKKAIEYAEEYDMKMGYEVTAPFETVREIINGIASKRFGLNLDLGHAAAFAARGGPSPLKWIEEFKDKIVEVHVHDFLSDWSCGVGPDAGGAHQPLGRGNVIDWSDVIKALKDAGFQGPFICEILAKDAPSMLEYCIDAKRKITKYWK